MKKPTNVTRQATIRTIRRVFSLRFLRIRLAITSSAMKNAKHVKNSGLNVRMIQNDSCVIKYPFPIFQ